MRYTLVERVNGLLLFRVLLQRRSCKQRVHRRHRIQFSKLVSLESRVTHAPPIPCRNDGCGPLPRTCQVSMLQRQSNSLASRAASLEDELSDQTALVEALQMDRLRLEQELDQYHQPTRRPQDPQEVGQNVLDQALALAAPVAEVADGASSPLKDGNAGVCGAVDDTTDDKSGIGMAVAAAVDAVAETPAATLAAAVEAADRKAGAAIAATEARCLALAEMADSLVVEKVEWEEERASRAAEAMRLRARARGLEEAFIEHDVGSKDKTEGGGRQGVLVEGLRRLLRERTRELEVKAVAMETLGEAW